MQKNRSVFFLSSLVSIFSYFYIPILLLCLFLFWGCETKTGEKPLTEKQYQDLSTNEWLNRKLPAFHKATLLSKVWLDTVNINPLQLRRYGIKGKKKLVELFEAYLAIYKFLPGAEKESLDRRLNDIANVPQKLEYHNMAYVNKKQFKEDATSYLRLCYLMESRGFDTSIYQEEIKKIHPRLNEHMPTRGVNQQMSFHRYYNYFNLKEPFPLNKAYEKGIITGQWDAAAMNDKDVYGLTHEIFAVYQYGDKPEADFFSEEDKIYLKGILKNLISRYIESDNPDLTAELLSCMYFLEMQDESIFKAAVDYLLLSRNADGSFGNFERLRLIYGDYVKEGYYLHTTSVALKALSLVFGNIEIGENSGKAI